MVSDVLEESVTGGLDGGEKGGLPGKKIGRVSGGSMIINVGREEVGQRGESTVSEEGGHGLTVGDA